MVQKDEEEAKGDKHLVTPNDQSNVNDHTGERLVGENLAQPLMNHEPDVKPTRYLSLD